MNVLSELGVISASKSAIKGYESKIKTHKAQQGTHTSDEFVKDCVREIFKHNSIIEFEEWTLSSGSEYSNIGAYSIEEVNETVNEFKLE